MARLGNIGALAKALDHKLHQPGKTGYKGQLPHRPNDCLVNNSGDVAVREI
jgi:hypothetical protein